MIKRRLIVVTSEKIHGLALRMHIGNVLLQTGRCRMPSHARLTGISSLQTKITVDPSLGTPWLTANKDCIMVIIYSA